MIHVLTDLGNFFLWGSSALLVVFVVQYAILAPFWRNSIGITIVGEALCILAIFFPSLLAGADPHDFASFATTTWYQLLAVGIVFLTFAFTLTRIITWERIRRQRGAREDVQADADSEEVT